MAAWMGGEFGAEWIHVYVWLNPSAVHLKLSQQYTPIQNKKLYILKKRLHVWLSFSGALVFLEI